MGLALQVLRRKSEGKGLSAKKIRESTPAIQPGGSARPANFNGGISKRPLVWLSLMGGN